MIKLKELLFEMEYKRIYFLRDTNHPREDLYRNFSCHIDGWVPTEKEALEWQKKHGALCKPKQDPVSKHWCADPELGLSSFAFYDEPTFKRALKHIEIYLNATNPKIGVFSSQDYKFQCGADGEDVFTNGTFLGYLHEPFTWENVKKLII